MITWDTVFPFWDSLSDLQQTDILDNTIIRQYAEGEIIKKRQGLYMVNDGSVLVYVIHGNGRKRVLLTGNRQDVIILTIEFLKASTDISIEVRAKKDTELYYIPEETWDRYQEMNPAIRKFTIETLSKHMFVLSTSLYEGMQNISKQLAMFLLRSVGNKNSKTIEISHEELADQLGTTREVITRNISMLKNIGFVETGRNKIHVIDVEGMNEFVNQETD
ncbi:MAG: Crp/Fnr family transcriptional regulator [Solobacterium sp.]|nr:Crp/Fnr family transcriptional regulator [Solobacterium sp.]